MFLEKNFLDLVSLSDKTVFDLKNQWIYLDSLAEGKKKFVN